MPPKARTEPIRAVLRFLEMVSASDLDVKRNPVPRDASVEQNPTGSGIGLGARRPPGPVCFLEKSDWLKLVLVAGMPEPARQSPFYRRLLLAGDSARRDGFDDYGDTRYHATTPTRRCFERTRPPHPAALAALTNPHSCQPPCCPALCQGRRSVGARRARRFRRTHGVASRR